MYISLSVYTAILFSPIHVRTLRYENLQTVAYSASSMGMDMKCFWKCKACKCLSPYLSARIKDAGIAVRHLRGYTFSILQGPETDLREWNGCVHTQKNRKPYKRHFFLIEKCFEDARQDEKHVPDLLESIIQPTDPVKEELRQKLFKIDQISSKIKKVRVSKFWIPEFQFFPAGGQCQPSH